MRDTNTKDHLTPRIVTLMLKGREYQSGDRCGTPKECTYLSTYIIINFHIKILC